MSLRVVEIPLIPPYSGGFFLESWCIVAVFVDRVDITVQSGNGGPGSSSFRREKFVAKGGPDGGDGGRGGDVVIKATARLQTLMDLTLRSRYVAQHGEHGGKKQMFGCDGRDCLIEVPVGTVVLDRDGEILADLLENGQEYIPAKGGKGGRGNQHFATSVNRTPRYAQPGLPGAEARLVLELRLLASVGLVGLPNAGKSTLLHAITRANPKIADYPFTTLWPNLGVLKFPDREIVFADIPGLIEGASEGHGLGHDFLRHVDRTKVLIHLVAIDLEGPEATFEAYQVVRNELGQSEYSMSDKANIVGLNKTDTVDAELVEMYVDFFRERDVVVIPFSGLTSAGVPDLIKAVVRLLD